jgi:hypothetical protein
MKRRNKNLKAIGTDVVPKRFQKKLQGQPRKKKARSADTCCSNKNQKLQVKKFNNNNKNSQHRDNKPPTKPFIIN